MLSTENGASPTWWRVVQSDPSWRGTLKLAAKAELLESFFQNCICSNGGFECLTRWTLTKKKWAKAVMLRQAKVTFLCSETLNPMWGTFNLLRGTGISSLRLRGNQDRAEALLRVLIKQIVAWVCCIARRDWRLNCQYVWVWPQRWVLFFIWALRDTSGRYMADRTRTIFSQSVRPATAYLAISLLQPSGERNKPFRQ